MGAGRDAEGDVLQGESLPHTELHEVRLRPSVLQRFQHCRLRESLAGFCCSADSIMDCKFPVSPTSKNSQHIVLFQEC
jgi:hypothetical protein